MVNPKAGATEESLKRIRQQAGHLRMTKLGKLCHPEGFKDLAKKGSVVQVPEKCKLYQGPMPN